MKNYYEILEVNQKASPEIIDKVYKTLVKKYHPDLQPDKKKQEAEQKIKLINEAYYILSDKNKRELYDKELENNFVDINKYNLIVNENIKLKKELYNIKSKINTYNNYTNNTNTNSYSNFNNYYSNTQAKNSYNRFDNSNYTKNTSYQANNMHYTYNPNNNDYSTNYYSQNSNFSILDKFKNLFKTIIAILITFVIIFIIFQIPFFKNILFSLNFENELFIFPLVVLFIYFINKK